MSTFGGWRDDDEDATADRHGAPSPVSPPRGSGAMLAATSSAHFAANSRTRSAAGDGGDSGSALLSNTMTLDLTDLAQHPERNLAALPDAWKPDALKQKENERQARLDGIQRSPLNSGLHRAASNKFAAAARFTVLMQRSHRRTNTNSGIGGYAGSMYQPTHDDDLAAYIQSKEERRREKEAAKQLAADAHVPAHVKQMIHREIRSHGRFKQQKQYGYTEPVSLPLHRRLEALSRAEDAGESAQQGPVNTSARGGGGAAAVSSPVAANHSRSLVTAASTATGGSSAAGGNPSVMCAKRAKPEWNGTTSGAAVQLQMPVRRQQAAASAPAGGRRARSLPAPSTAAPATLAAPAAAMPPQHAKRKKSIDYIAALSEYGRHGHAANASGLTAAASGAAANGDDGVQVRSYPRAREHSSVQQYLADVRHQESAIALAALPAEAAKLVDESAAQTQQLRDRVRDCKAELDNLTQSGETLRGVIAAGAPAARKFAQMQQVKTRLLAEKRQREGRCRDLEQMTATLLKRLEKQQQRKQEEAEAAAREASREVMFPPIQRTAPADAKKPNFFGLTEVAAGDANKSGGAAAVAAITGEQLVELHRRVDDLRLRRDALLREREKRIRAASAAFEPRHDRIARQNARRAASSSAPPAGRKGQQQQRSGLRAHDLDDPPPAPKPVVPSRQEQRWIDEQAAALKRQLQQDLDREMQRLQKEHDRAMNHRRRDAERGVEAIVRSRDELATKLQQISATAEQHTCTTAEQRMAQAALDSQVAEKQAQLRQLTEQRRANEEAIKRHGAKAQQGALQLEKLRQELLVAEGVAVSQHLDEDAKRSRIRGEFAQRAATLKAEERQLAKRIEELQGRSASVEADTQAVAANPPTREPAVVQLDAEATLEESQIGAARIGLDAATQRHAAARQRNYTAKQNKLANEAQDQEIASLTRALEGKRAKLAHENARNMEMLEKLDRAERLLSLSGGLTTLNR